MKDITQIKHQIEMAFLAKKWINNWLILLIQNKENPNFYIDQIKENVNDLEKALLNLTFELIKK